MLNCVDSVQQANCPSSEGLLYPMMRRMWAENNKNMVDKLSSLFAV